MLLKYSFPSRNRLPQHLNNWKLTGLGVEVGTHRGHYAKQILQQWRGKCLYCVDPWVQYRNDDFVKVDPACTGDREADLAHTQHILGPFIRKKRCKLLRDTSAEAVKLFKDESLDFVYVDGSHLYDDVLFDLRAWWPKLREGGILAGHDFICPAAKGMMGWAPEIQPAVFQFGEEERIAFLYLITEPKNNNWSYFMRKGEVLDERTTSLAENDSTRPASEEQAERGSDPDSCDSGV